MAAAAQNLCPVTLELGGKSPAIVCDDFPLQARAERILFVKCLNAGQICTTVDHAWLPRGPVEMPSWNCAGHRAGAYPQPRLARLHLDHRRARPSTGCCRRWTMRARGATLVQLVPGPAFDRATRKIAPHIVLDAPEERADAARDLRPHPAAARLRHAGRGDRRVNAGPRPLAIYPFSHDGAHACRCCWTA
jgi:coniferyl-aldehyde dehydrogenase